MTDKARELKQELERIFEVTTAASDLRACPPGGDVPMDDETRAAFESVEASTMEAIRQSLDPEILCMLPENDDMDNLRRALAFHPFYTYESWHVAKDVSERALFAAEKDIRAGRVAKLENLRDQKRKMSIRRIESAYATFLGDEKMSAAEMSVLVALAYVANDKREDDCYPSDRYLKLLTHLGDRTIRSARNSLRSRKIIDWISGGMSRQGGNVSNRYRFLFPYLKMPSQRERYQPLAPTRPTAPVAVPTAPTAVPYGGSRRTLRQELPTNTEETLKITSEEKPENRGVPRLSDLEFKFDSGVVDKSKRGLEKPGAPDREKGSVVDEAMRVCKVNDVENKRTFTSVMLTKSLADCLEEIMAFESEIRQGEHANAKNLPAILTARLKALRSQE